MVRVALGLEYDGSDFRGWQTQPGGPTVQSCVEQALSRVADHPVKAVCAGRTDTGVHASGQVIHFDTHAERHERSWVLGANVNLPSSVSVVWAMPVAEDFHARFSALVRRYRYVILNRPTRSGLLASRVTWECRPLAVEPMREAAQYLRGEHDFSGYRAQACQAKSPVRTVNRLDLIRIHEMIVLDIEANAFLYHMVRNIVGVLMAIGRGEASPTWADDVLTGRDRASGGVTAPPHGLYLTRVGYSDRYRLPAPSPMSLPL